MANPGSGWKSPKNWLRNWFLNKWSFGALKQRFEDNFSDGYDFGDVTKSLFGISRFNEDMSPMTAAQVAEWKAQQDGGSSSGSDGGSSSLYNDLSGVSASQRWQTAERQASERFTHEENELARSWQEHMSNTAIQRQMADAQAAGINPIHLVGSNSGAGVANASGSSVASAAPSSGNSAAAVAASMTALAKIISSMAS